MKEQMGKIEQLQRRVNYSKYVKEVHLPPKSHKKELEMATII